MQQLDRTAANSRAMPASEWPAGCAKMPSSSSVVHEASFVTRSQSASNASRDTLHEIRFTDDENAAGGLCQQPARTEFSTYGEGNFHFSQEVRSIVAPQRGMSPRFHHRVVAFLHHNVLLCLRLVLERKGHRVFYFLWNFSPIAD